MTELSFTGNFPEKRFPIESSQTIVGLSGQLHLISVERIFLAISIVEEPFLNSDSIQCLIGSDLNSFQKGKISTKLTKSDY